MAASGPPLSFCTARVGRALHRTSTDGFDEDPGTDGPEGRVGLPDAGYVGGRMIASRNLRGRACMEKRNAPRSREIPSSR